MRGLVGLAGGSLLLFGLSVELFTANWKLGIALEWLFTPLLAFLVPAALGIVSPLWYWVGRPIWCRLARSRAQGSVVRSGLREARFLPGLAGSLLGLLVLGPVTATAGFWVQAMLPLGLLIGLGAPLWYWIFRPLGRQLFARPDRNGSEDWLAGSAVRWGLAALFVLAVLSVLVTAVVSLPIVEVGQPITTGSGMELAVTDVETRSSIRAADGDLIDGGAGGVLLVRVEGTNGGDTPSAVPGDSVGDVAVISETCEAQTFGEPSNNCNRVYLDGNFTAGDRAYANWGVVRERAGGSVGPDERLGGWLAYRIEGRSAEGFEGMVIVDDVGRWRFGVDGAA